MDIRDPFVKVEGLLKMSLVSIWSNSLSLSLLQNVNGLSYEFSVSLNVYHIIACPNPTVGWVMIAIFSVLTISFMVYLVYQGRSPKNKESVSSRILVNHLQMLALLSGNSVVCFMLIS